MSEPDTADASQVQIAEAKAARLRAAVFLAAGGSRAGLCAWSRCGGGRVNVAHGQHLTVSPYRG